MKPVPPTGPRARTHRSDETGPSRRRDARSVGIRRAGTASSKRWGRRVPVVMCRRCPIRRLPSAKAVLFDIDGTLIGPITFR